MYKGHADWTKIAAVKQSKNTYSHFGNGDIDSPLKAKEYKEKYGIDGIMIEGPLLDIHGFFGK